MQITVPTLAEARQAFGAQAVGHAGLRPGLDAQRRLAERRGHLDLRAQRRLRERDAEVVDEVVAMALEARILLDVEHRDEIAARAVARAGNSLPSQRQIVVIGDAGGHVDLNRLLTLHAPLAAAAVAGAVDDGALTGAGGTGRDGEELAEERLRLAAHFSGPAARAALHGLRARLGTAARALGTGLETLDAHRLGGAGGDFGKRELQAHLDVVPAAPIAPLSAAEDALKASTTSTAETEIPHEDHKRFGQIEVHRAEATTLPASAHARCAVAIVGRAFLGIAQHFVRFGDQLEALFGDLVTVVAVGVALHRELAVGLLDVGFARVLRDAEDGIEILLHAIRAAPPRAATCD